jgi:2-(1,2-epoxy-1,2-dihydrophenyl)acetyl-CoA isomerase
MQLAEQLREAAQHLRKVGTARVVTLTGRGRLFCAGGDVGEMADAADWTAFL